MGDSNTWGLIKVDPQILNLLNRIKPPWNPPDLMDPIRLGGRELSSQIGVPSLVSPKIAGINHPNLDVLLLGLPNYSNVFFKMSWVSR